MNFKKIIRILVAGGLLLAMLSSCDNGPELLGIIPAYAGAAVTSTTHEFKNEDFFVIASYADGTDEIVTDFEIVVEGMDAGYYIVTIRYKDQENECYVPLELDIYPSDNNG